MTIREQLHAARTAELITVQQLALLAQYDPQTIYRKAKKGEIPGMVRFGGGIRFLRTAVLAWTSQSVEARDLRPRV